MRIFAIIESGVVTNVIRAESWPGGIDVTNTAPRPGPGWTYDGMSFAPPPVAPVEVTAIERSALLARMTPQELHAWRPLYAWLRWEALEQTVDLTSADIRGLKNVWMALGMTAARAEELLAPLSA